MTYKTPGVYVEEIALFPPSVAQVETAIPAFIGYTHFALDANAKDLTGIPTKIKSLLEHETLFGKGYDVLNYNVVVDTTKNNMITSGVPDKRFYLYDALRQFYDNGGGDCYIVSVGSYSDTIGFKNLSGGIAALRKYDEPTLILFPDAVALVDSSMPPKPDLVNFAELQKQALKLCADLQDRFSILDIRQGDLKEDATNKPISDFRDNIGINFLNYGAAYYPWLLTNYIYEVDLRQLKISDTAGAAINDFIPFSKDDAEKNLLASFNTSKGETDLIIDKVKANTIANDVDRLRNEGKDYISEKADELKTKLPSSATPNDDFDDFLNLLAFAALVYDTIEKLPAISPVRKDVLKLKTDKTLTDALSTLISFEQNLTVTANADPARTAFAVLYQPLEVTQWLGKKADGITDKTIADITAEPTAFANTPLGSVAIITAMEKTSATLLSYFQTVLDTALFYESQNAAGLFSQHTFFKALKDKIQEVMRTLPPSGAVAGVCATVDRTRGVWKAPANISLNAVIGPVVKIDNHDQEDLNIHTTGKSVNAIRAFTGKGTLVWGARTLAGNDNEWRYISVRRFFIMVEESVKKATEPFVFESNDSNTWVKVRSMIENFLTEQWRAGALQGAKPEDAFFVHVGLGETMTGLDILEGRMIVEIGMAVVRPAEFIILRFSHKMQTK